MAKDALPDRYTVDRKGTPDPATAEYYVIDLVHDYPARVSLRRLVRDYRTQGQHVRADELEKALNDTADAHLDVIRARTPQVKARKTASKKERQDQTS